MSKREAVEKVVGRMYRHALRTTGRLPGAKEVREMEKKAKRAAENADNLKNRK